MNMTDPPPIKSIQTVFLEKPPCCIEVCPANSNYFIVGTYELQSAADNADTTNANVLEASGVDVKPGDQQRDGSLVVYLLKNDKM